MAIRKRAGKWIVDFVALDAQGNQIRYRRNLGPNVKTKRDAEVEEARLRTEHSQPEQASVSAPSAKEELPSAAFSGFARVWFDRHVKVQCKPSQIRKYESIIRTQLVPFFKDTPLVDIQAYDVEGFRSALVTGGRVDTGKPYASKTVNNVTSCLSSMLDCAARWGYLTSNPCRSVRLLKVPPNEMMFWDAAQTEIFLAKAESMEPDWHPFFVCAFRTGARLGELFGLQWGDVDFVKHRVCIRRSMYRDQFVSPKNNKARWVPMTADLERTLKSYKHLRGDFVFSRTDGKPLTRDIIKHPFNRLTFAAGLPRIRIHDVRHSFASQLAMAGVSLLAISKLLGHSGMQVTERYAHLSPSSLDEAVKVLEGKTGIGIAELMGKDVER